MNRAAPYPSLMQSAMPARAKLATQPLTGALIHKSMARLFPRRNDYGNASFDELVAELDKLGVSTLGSFERLMKKHRRQLLAIDRDRLTPQQANHFSEIFGETFVRDALRRQYWFAYPALVRTAAEIEFGEKAAVYEASL